MPSASGRSPRHWSLRQKFAVVLLVPALLALTVGGLRIVDQVAEVAELDRVAAVVDAQEGVADLSRAVAAERYAATAFVALGRTDPAALDAAVGQVAERSAVAATAVDALLADFPELTAPARQSEQALARLGDVRALARTSAAAPPAVLTRYTDILDRVAELDASLLRGITVLEVNGPATALAGIDVARAEASLQYAAVAALPPTGDADAAADLRSSEARLGAGLAGFRSALDAGQRVRHAGLIAGPANGDRSRVVQELLAGRPVPVEAPAVFDAALAAMDDAGAGVRAELVAGIADLRGAALGLAILNAVLLGLALLVTGLLVGLVARTMLRSLRRLRTGALDVAQRRLPAAVEQMKAVDGTVAPLTVEPIGIDSREEIGEVARAFDQVHGEAVRLAAQQALLRNNINDIFVNLSQRSQALVKRQLALIDELERSEQDPDHLGNLFRLDHLATRMRRNNENLLVLAGAAELRARRKRPVPARDVLRAAVSEIEQYRRVTVRRAPGLAVAGPVVNDLVHLVAELLDNATAFSPPDSEVVLRAATGAGGTLVVEIADGGVGMSPDELAAVNAQLADPPLVDVAVARRMGLFVVGRLAQRHNITVTLRSAPVDSGLWATVEVPAVYLQSGATPGAEPELDAPTAGLPVVVPAARTAPEPVADDAVAEAPAPAATVTTDAGLPRRAPRRDGPVPADDPLSGPWVPAPAEPDEHDAPIYGEMRSAWFRQRRFASALGADWQAQGVPARLADAEPAPNGAVSNGAVTHGVVGNGAVPEEVALQAPRSEESADEPRDALDPAAPAAAALDPAAPAAAEPEAVQPSEDEVEPGRAAADDPQPSEEAVEEQNDWGAVDAGFAAARSAADRRPDGTTAAGLPKRTPRSQLVPGSIAVAGGPSASRPPRSAEMVRGRLSGYQRGLREGREARMAEIARRAADGQAG